MKKVFNFGKIDYNKSGRKACPVEVEIEFRTTKNGELEFTACGDIWNPKHTSVYSVGQNLDEIAKYIKDPIFLEIYDLWKHYHLTTMHPGTEKQEEALEKWREQRKKEYDYPVPIYGYKLECDYLESIGLLWDMVDGKPYKYGTGWLTRKIPDEDINRINKLLEV